MPTVIDFEQKLQDLIAKEDKANPLSDEDLVNKFIEAGCPVTKLIVTKYREALKIPSAHQRKVWAS